MSLSITTLSPMPGATLPQTFNVCGTYDTNAFMKEHPDRNSLFAYSNSITVALSGPGNVSASSVTVGSTTWTAVFSNVGAASGYVITATLSDGTDSISNTVETVAVSSRARIIINDPCAQKAAPATELLKLGAAKKKVSLKGEHDGTAGTSILGVVQKLDRSVEQVNAHHKRHHFKCGTYVRHAPGKTGANNTWTLDIEVDSETYVAVHLLDGNGDSLGCATSQLY